ncbi:hypothetical protein E5288_WYG017192 [Bos mutus]|uniref:Uncharacterized protein n=1 Tax=Bos mutus TaxID=72004 RepID=A0A6B0RLD4_9CETA|nr:hypothetical protein [Bos mutus]
MQMSIQYHYDTITSILKDFLPPEHWACKMLRWERAGTVSVWASLLNVYLPKFRRTKPSCTGSHYPCHLLLGPLASLQAAKDACLVEVEASLCSSLPALTLPIFNLAHGPLAQNPFVLNPCDDFRMSQFRHSQQPRRTTGSRAGKRSSTPASEPDYSRQTTTDADAPVTDSVPAQRTLGCLPHEELTV